MALIPHPNTQGPQIPQSLGLAPPDSLLQGSLAVHNLLERGLLHQALFPLRQLWPGWSYKVPKGPSLTWSVSIFGASPSVFTWSYTCRLWGWQGHWGWWHSGVTWTLISPGARGRQGQGGAGAARCSIPSPHFLSGCLTKQQQTPKVKLTLQTQSSDARGHVGGTGKRV